MSAFIQEPIPSSGPVTILRDQVEANFGDSMIIQHGGTFRMFKYEAWKVTLDPLDALWIIETLKLAAKPNEVFARSVTWAVNP